MNTIDKTVYEDIASFYNLKTANLHQLKKLNNTSLHYAIEGKLSDEIELGTTRELFFIQSVSNANRSAHHSKVEDYAVEGSTFEIGGQNKTLSQIKGTKQAYLVKDNMLTPGQKEIPLMLFFFFFF